MAIRDRLSVKTKDGDVTRLTVTKQGGSITHTTPTRGNPWLVATIWDKNGQPTDEQLTVAETEIVYYIRDKAPRTKK